MANAAIAPAIGRDAINYLADANLPMFLNAIGMPETFTQAATVAAIGATSNLTAVPGSFADLAAVQTYLVTLRSEAEARLDAIETKVDALLAALKTAGLVATS